MRSVFLAAALASYACGPEMLPAHDLEVVLDYDGFQTAAVIHFEEHTPGNYVTEGECYGGTCIRRYETFGAVNDPSGRIVSAIVMAVEEPLTPTWTLDVARTPEDDAAFKALNNIYVNEPRIHCYVEVSTFEEPVRCSFSAQTVLLTADVNKVY